MKLFLSKILLISIFTASLSGLINLSRAFIQKNERSSPPCSFPGQTWISPVDGAALVCVPAGSFTMGAVNTDPLAGEDEKPQHTVQVDAFWIDRTEVSNAMYAQCMAAGACNPKMFETTALTYIPYAVHPDYQDHPALIYLAKDAEAYCRWAGRRLPNEAEWEKAARGTDGRLYPWGNALDCSRANYYICDHVPDYDPGNPRCGYSSFCRTASVTDYASGASPYGALNMAGNVWEWVDNTYTRNYEESSNRYTGETETFRVRRGGGCTSLAADLRVTARASGKGEHYYDGQMGFRCAMDPQN